MKSLLLQEEEKLTWERLKARGQKELLAYTLITKTDYQVNWSHSLVCNALDKFVRGEIKRLMIFEQPRVGKSELVSRRLPSFAFGLYPDINILQATYGDDLSRMHNNDVQRIMSYEVYKELFPNTQLPGEISDNTTPGKWIRTSNMFQIVGRKGFYRSTGVGGALTGMGADMLIIDDPFKNRKEADSQVVRDMVWNWYASTAYTRLEKDGRILLTMTRWHEDDLAGRLIKQMKEDPDADQWVVISLPAIYESEIPTSYDPRLNGEALWPEKYNEDRLKTIKASIGTREWNALFQQRPSALEGSTIKRKWFKFYKELPDSVVNYMQSWDLSFDDKEGSSHTVGQVWGQKGANLYLIDQVRDQMNFPAQIQAVRTFSAKHPKVHGKLIENKANAHALISTLEEEIYGIIRVEPKGSKEDRAKAASPSIEAGNVWLPDPSIAPWVHDFLDECANFPNGTNKDQVDTMTQAILRYRQGLVDEFTQDYVQKPKHGTFAGRLGTENRW